MRGKNSIIAHVTTPRLPVRVRMISIMFSSNSLYDTYLSQILRYRGLTQDIGIVVVRHTQLIGNARRSRFTMLSIRVISDITLIRLPSFKRVRCSM